MQIVCTFIFVFTILHVTGQRTMGPDLGIWGLPAICLVLWGLAFVGGYSSASVNPALATGSTIFQLWLYPNNPSKLLTHYAPMYIGGASLGGVLAGIFYTFHEKLFPSSEDEETLFAHAVNETGSVKI